MTSDNGQNRQIKHTQTLTKTFTQIGVLVNEDLCRDDITVGGKQAHQIDVRVLS